MAIMDVNLKNNMRFAEIKGRYRDEVEILLKKFAYMANNEKTRNAIVESIQEHFDVFIKKYNCDITKLPKLFLLCNEVNNTPETIHKKELHVACSIYDNDIIHNINFCIKSECEKLTDEIMKTWKDLKICDVIAKRRELEKQIRLHQNDYACYLDRCGRHEISEKIRNWDISTESEYYDTLFEIDCHFSINLINDIFALKTVEKELLIEIDKKRVEELFENELKG